MSYGRMANDEDQGLVQVAVGVAAGNAVRNHADVFMRTPGGDTATTPRTVMPVAGN
ncbi:hypothetical protein [Microbispora rosea]